MVARLLERHRWREDDEPRLSRPGGLHQRTETFSRKLRGSVTRRSLRTVLLSAGLLSATVPPLSFLVLASTALSGLSGLFVCFGFWLPRLWTRVSRSLQVHGSPACFEILLDQPPALAHIPMEQEGEAIRIWICSSVFDSLLKKTLQVSDCLAPLLLPCIGMHLFTHGREKRGGEPPSGEKGWHGDQV